MTVPRLAESDVYEMHAVHAAFRRDLARLAAIAAAGQADCQAVLAGWANFKRQLLVHHAVEDADLWPRLRRLVADRPADLAVLDEMETEHAQIGPLLDAVDAALGREPGRGQNGELAGRAAALADALARHFRHEETSAIPLMRNTLSRADLRRFKAAMARRQGLSGAATFIPWIVDGTDDAARRRFLALMPALARLANWLYWERRYRRRRLWG